MLGRGYRLRLLVGLAVLGLLSGCASGATLSPPPATPVVTVAPSVAVATPTVTATPTPTAGASPGGSMTAMRAYGTATLLADGRVLVAGGFVASADLYDPKTGTFTATGSLPPALGFHTATLLPDGNVLITGGVDANLEQVINAAWLYNPKTGTFSATGSMATPRHQHTATLLSDGRVLIVGGAPSGASDITTASAEIYEPKTGTFSATGKMKTARAAHTAILLGDGRVLVAGGYPSGGGDTDIASAEVYNPKSGTFSPTGSMTTPRGLQTMTLLPDGRVLVVGGCYNGSGQASADLYNPKTGKFSPTGSMATPRCYQTATLLPDGRVLIAGGFSNVSGLSLASTELYNPKTGTFSPTGSMTAARAAQTATLLPDGNVLITGGDAWGFMGGNNLASAEIYDPKTGTFSPTGP